MSVLKNCGYVIFSAHCTKNIGVARKIVVSTNGIQAGIFLRKGFEPFFKFQGEAHPPCQSLPTPVVSILEPTSPPTWLKVCFGTTLHPHPCRVL